MTYVAKHQSDSYGGSYMKTFVQSDPMFTYLGGVAVSLNSIRLAPM